MSELELFTEALNRTDPAERAAFLDRACAGNPALRQRLEELLAGHAQSRGPLDRPPLGPETVDLATTHATDPQRPDEGAETLAHVAPKTAAAATAASTPPTDASDPQRPDDGAATLAHVAAKTAAAATAASTLPPADGTEVFRTGGAATLDLSGTAVPGPSRVSWPGAAQVTMAEGIGTVIAGRYTLVDVIGEGGMGSVYLAEQSEPVKRRVALKLIKTGMDSRAVLARFDAERQALAMMDHPNIARIYDGGVTPARQPFFVMELVNGVPLTTYCDQKRLTVRDRLELFVSVCQAVQHAHQKGIIHRDLKPGNVLVTEVDGRPTPKVIDFGVAKATEVNLTEMSFADTGAIVGTPTYMSPEQADPSSMDIDTRTDVYALGVMLYELLVGSPPLDARQFKRGAVLEMLRMVREVEPPRPSTRLSGAENSPNIAANRSIEPARLASLLQGELDWVVMKALEKDRDRRYDTANGFARDIQRYLADEVVEARPPSRGYRLKKFVKRNKIQVIAASLVFLTLIGGIVGTSLGMASARRARDAEAVQRAKADEQRDKAIAAERRTAIERDNALLAQARTSTIDSFLTNDILTQAEPTNNAVEDKVTLLEVVDRAAAKVGTRFTERPELELYIRRVLADVYHGLASWDKAEEQARLSLDKLKKDAPHSAERYKIQGFLAHILWHRGRTDPEVVTMAEEAVKGLERVLGPDEDDTQSAANELAMIYESIGRNAEAIALLERARAASIANLGSENRNTLTVLANLAFSYQRANQPEKALPLFEDVVRRQAATLGTDHQNTQMTRSNLAFIYYSTGRLKEAIPLLEQVYAGSKRYPEFRDIVKVLIEAYRDSGRPEKAVPLIEEYLAQKKIDPGPDHPETLSMMMVLATTLRQANQLEKAIPIYEETLKRREAAQGRDSVPTQLTAGNLGAAYLAAGRIKEAIPLLEETHRSSQRHAELRWAGGLLVEAYERSGEHVKLAEFFERQLIEARGALPKDSPELAGVMARYGLQLLQIKKWGDAEAPLRESLAIREKTQPDLWSTFNTQSLLGGALLGQKKYTDAEPLLVKGYEGMKEREKTIPPQASIRLPEALDRLIELYTAVNKPDELTKRQAERAKYPNPAPPPGEKK